MQQCSKIDAVTEILEEQQMPNENLIVETKDYVRDLPHFLRRGSRCARENKALGMDPWEKKEKYLYGRTES